MTNDVMDVPMTGDVLIKDGINSRRSTPASRFSSSSASSIAYKAIESDDAQVPNLMFKDRDDDHWQQQIGFRDWYSTERRHSDDNDAPDRSTHEVLLCI